MQDEEWDERLAARVYGLVRQYVNRRTEDKSGLKYESFGKNKDDEGRVRYPPKYLEAKEKVCSDAFLAMRGRRDEAFIEYFVGTICSVPQFLPRNDYEGVCKALMTDWQKVKTLAMLALSAASYSPRREFADEKGEAK